MFSTKELDSKYVDEAILTSLNNLFNCLNSSPLTDFTDLVDQRTLVNICQEMDSVNYNSLQKSFLYEKNLGIFFAEINDLIGKMKELLKKTGISFKSTFNKDFDSINVNSLIKYDKNEVKKLVNLIILSVFNCPEKDTFIDKIAYFEEFQQQELLKIVERYITIDDQTRESIASKNVSQRNTIRNSISNEMLSSTLIESEYVSKYLSRIENLEKEKDTLEKEKFNFTEKVHDLENEVNAFKKEKTNLKEELKQAQEISNKAFQENQDLKKQKSELQNTIKELEAATKELKFVNDYKSKLDEKDSEIAFLKNEITEKENIYETDVKALEDKIQILQDNISNLSEMKVKYEKMKDMIKDHEALKEKNKYFETVNREFTKMKNNYIVLKEERDSLEILVKELEEKLDNNIKNISKLREGEKESPNLNDPITSIKSDLRYESILREKEVHIKSLESKLSRMEYERTRKSIQKQNEDDEDLLHILKLKEDTIKNQEETLHLYHEKIRKLENEILEGKENLENEVMKRNEDIEFYKKDNSETKERYEKEFELMASSIYNLGLTYWSMKMEYAQKLSEKPNWLIKERQKFFNGDF